MQRKSTILNVCLSSPCSESLSRYCISCGQCQVGKTCLISIHAGNHKLLFKWEHRPNYLFLSAPSLVPATNWSSLMSKQDLKNHCRVTKCWLGHYVCHLFCIASGLWTKEVKIVVISEKHCVGIQFSHHRGREGTESWLFQKLPGALTFEDTYEGPIVF